MLNTLSRLMLSGIPRQTDDASGAAVTGKRRQAKHELIGTDGAVLADDQGEPDAYGIRYSLLALPGKSFTYKFGENPDADRMLACFGAKTLATNETSAARNSDKGEASAEEQLDAVIDRFALLATGQWVDRTGGVGAKVNLDALAEAICQVLVSEGKKTQEEVDGGYKATIRQKVEDDKVFVRKSRTHNGVLANYAAIVGRTTATTDDLMA